MHRQRILDHLMLVSSVEDLLAYQKAIPSVDVAAEVFNQWDDCFHPGWAEFDAEFSDQELASLKAFAHTLDAIAEETPQYLPPIEQFLASEHGKRLRDSAKSTLSMMDPVSSNE